MAFYEHGGVPIPSTQKSRPGEESPGLENDAVPVPKPAAAPHPVMIQQLRIDGVVTPCWQRENQQTGERHSGDRCRHGIDPSNRTKSERIQPVSATSFSGGVMN